MIVQIEIYDIIGKASSLPRFCGDAGATQHHHLSASLSPLSSLPLPLFSLSLSLSLSLSVVDKKGNGNSTLTSPAKIAISSLEKMPSA